jgi:hypothetical protein
MDGKIIIYGFCLALVAAGSFFWKYTMDIDEVQKEMLLARQQLNASEDGVKQAKGWLNARKEAAALIAAGSVIEKKNEELRQAIQKLKDKRKEVARVFESSMQRVRDETQGMQLQEVILTTGAKFLNVKIQSVDENIAVLQHSQGVSKVPTEDLPNEILDRLRFGFIPGGAGTINASSKKSGAFLAPSTKPLRHERSQIESRLNRFA